MIKNAHPKTSENRPFTEQDPFEVFFDGQCPLCVREIHMIRRKDKQQRIKFTDFADEEFDDSTIDITYDQLMSQIHGRFPDGKVVRGVEVFRQLYSRIGFGKLVFITRIPPISWLLAVCYRLFARFRLRLTGRHCGDACSVPLGKQQPAATPTTENANVSNNGEIN